MEYVGNHKRNSEVEPLCSYPFTVMVFVFLCVLFFRALPQRDRPTGRTMPCRKQE